MRTALIVAVLTTCVAASPGWAQQAAPLRASERVERLTGTNVPYQGLALTPDFHLRIEFAPRPVAELLIDPNSNLRQRFASSMMDYYPFGGEGFHLSGGLRFYDRTNFLREAEKMTHGLLYLPRMPGGGIGLRGGYKRMTPAFTLGYTRMVEHNLLLGIEAGSLLGRVNPSMPRAFREIARANLGNEPSGMNPIVNMVVGFKF